MGSSGKGRSKKFKLELPDRTKVEVKFYPGDIQNLAFTAKFRDKRFSNTDLTSLHSELIDYWNKTTIDDSNDKLHVLLNVRIGLQEKIEMELGWYSPVKGLIFYTKKPILSFDDVRKYADDMPPANERRYCSYKDSWTIPGSLCIWLNADNIDQVEDTVKQLTAMLSLLKMMLPVKRVKRDGAPDDMYFDQDGVEYLKKFFAEKSIDFVKLREEALPGYTAALDAQTKRREEERKKSK